MKNDRCHLCIDCWFDITPKITILACPCCRTGHPKGHAK